MVNKKTLSELLEYDSKSGQLTWKFRSRKHFDSERVFKLWNSKFSGRKAFTSVGSHGYFFGSIFNKQYLAHRVIWVLLYGENDQYIDHLDGNKLNNRLENLRKVSNVENSKNRGFKKNSSGAMGVYWCKRRNKWRVCIGVKYKTKHIGYFINLKTALNARKNAEIAFGFHPNHGRKLSV